jgi:hypothetical protein
VVLLVVGSLSNVVGVENPQGCGCGDPPCWVELSGTMGDNNWYVSSVFVGFNGSFYEINYRIDGGGWQTYTAPFGLTSNGIHLVEWYCDDNMSNIGSVEIKIDKTAPFITGSKQERIGLFIWQISVNASDETSGVNRVEFYLADFVDNEPPYEVIWRGFMWIHNFLDDLITLITGVPSIRIDVWDNAGNSLIKPSYR